MKNKIMISIDAMGGENAPHSALAGAEIAASQHNDLDFMIMGKAEIIQPIMENYPNLAKRYALVNCDDVISDEEQPMKALRQGKESSMRKALDVVKSGSADACVSGGNTGALMMMAKVVLGDLAGIKRPAITSTFPSAAGRVVLLDVGANPECDPTILQQFATMGACYAKGALDIKNPRVGLLNIGSEDGKGRELEKLTFELLKSSKINFIGNVEPSDITSGNVDVVVTDGFTGNIVIKTAEATASMFLTQIKQAFTSSFFGKILGLLVKRKLKYALSDMDHRKYNGAMFVGVNGVVVKSHGSSDHIAFANAINLTYNLVRNGINTNIINLIGDDINHADNIIDKLKKTSAKLFGKNK